MLCWLTVMEYLCHKWPRICSTCHKHFSGVRVTRSLVLCVCFVDRCLSFCAFSFGHCVFCSSSMCGFWLPLWYLQTLLNISHCDEQCVILKLYWLFRWHCLLMFIRCNSYLLMFVRCNSCLLMFVRCNSSFISWLDCLCIG